MKDTTQLSVVPFLWFLFILLWISIVGWIVGSAMAETQERREQEPTLQELVVQNNEAVKRIERRVPTIPQRFDRVEVKLQRIEDKLDLLLEKTEKQK